MKKPRKRTVFRLALAAFWMVVTGWLFLNMQASGVDPAVLASGPSVVVSHGDSSVTFSPRDGASTAGLIFYPGALVQPTAYAPLAHAVASQGFAVVILELPYRLAPLAAHRQDLGRRTREWISTHPGTWVVGGHSRGGALAAQFARDHAPSLGGLLLVGTSHPREDDLSALPIDVTKVYATEDGLASVGEIEEFGVNLPAGTHWHRIEGGNHAQFGWYGWQIGDGRARIDRRRQMDETVAAIVAQLRRLEG